MSVLRYWIAPEHLPLHGERRPIQRTVSDLPPFQARGHGLEKCGALLACQRRSEVHDECELIIVECNHVATTRSRGGYRHQSSWSRYASLRRNESQSARFVRGSSGPSNSLRSSG